MVATSLQVLVSLLDRARDDHGASLVEYALLLALLAVVCISAITFLGDSASQSFSTSSSSMFVGN